MPESKDRDWIRDGAATKFFSKFEDRLHERFLDGNGGRGRRAQEWYMNSDAPITEDNLQEFCYTLWAICSA
jgi:hypothetical protein